MTSSQVLAEKKQNWVPPNECVMKASSRCVKKWAPQPPATSSATVVVGLALVPVATVADVVFGAALDEHPARVSTMATAAIAPRLRTVGIYTTSVWPLVRRVRDYFGPRLDAKLAKRIVTV